MTHFPGLSCAHSCQREFGEHHALRSSNIAHPVQLARPLTFPQPQPPRFRSRAGQPPSIRNGDRLAQLHLLITQFAQSVTQSCPFLAHPMPRIVPSCSTCSGLLRTDSYGVSLAPDQDYGGFIYTPHITFTSFQRRDIFQAN